MDEQNEQSKSYNADNSLNSKETDVTLSSNSNSFENQKLTSRKIKSHIIAAIAANLKDIITNNGGTNIYLSLDEISTDVSTNGYIDASAGDVSFDWEDDILEPGQSTTLTISVPVTAGNSGGSSSEPVEVYDTVQGGSVSVTANFKIIATQSN